MTALEPIKLDKNLNIKKLDPNNEKDMWLVKELDKDELITGKEGYLWPISNVIRNTRYLFREDIYASPYAIYDREKPIGYIELSDILIIKNILQIDLAYAILKEERKKGYATKTLLEVTKKILEDSKIEKTTLLIAKQNTQSISVAEKAGYIRDDSINILETIAYQKTKRHI